MKLWSSLSFIVLLAFISMAALIGMLVFDGVWDVILLFVAIIPMVVGIWRTCTINKKINKKALK